MFMYSRFGFVDSTQIHHLGDLYTESGQTLQSSFSAVSKPIFATKYSLESSRRDLQNALICTALHFQIFRKIAKHFANFHRDFARFCQILQYFHEISLEFCRDFPGESAPAPGSSWEFLGVPASFPRFAAFGNSPRPAIPRVS